MKAKFKPSLPTLPVRKPREETAPDMGQLRDINVSQSEPVQESTPVSELVSTPVLETPTGKIPERPVFDDEYEARIETYRQKCRQYEMYGGVNPKFPGANHYEKFGGTKADDFLSRTIDEVVVLYENGLTDPHDLWKKAEAEASIKLEAWWHPPAEKKVWN